LSLPDNVYFLPGAAEELTRLRATAPKDHEALLAALCLLGTHGPPADTCYVAVQEAPFPNTLAYRFKVGGYAIVFECDQRVVMRSASGLKVVRALRSGAADACYIIWAIWRSAD
jgi:hypothetical protein